MGIEDLNRNRLLLKTDYRYSFSLDILGRYEITDITALMSHPWLRQGCFELPCSKLIDNKQNIRKAYIFRKPLRGVYFCSKPPYTLKRTVGRCVGKNRDGHRVCSDSSNGVG